MRIEKVDTRQEFEAALVRAFELDPYVLVEEYVAGEEITVAWKKLLAGTTPDVLLQQGDFVIVKESFF